MPTVPYGDSELEHVLRDLFPGQAGGAAGPSSSGLGEDVDVNVEGGSPAITYAGGPQSQRQGLRGRRARRVMRQYSEEIGEPQYDCPTWMLRRDCRNLVSRLLEETFRNFQMTVRKASHVDPPFRSICYDRFTGKDGITVPVAPYLGVAGAWTNIVAFSMPKTKYRGVLRAIGHAVEDLAAWDQLEWQILISGVPHPEYQGIRQEIWEFLPLKDLVCPVRLLPGDSAILQARNYDPVNTYVAHGRIAGWYYPLRIEAGDSIRSTIVD